MLYRVKFTRPDGTTGWLIASYCGPTDEESKSPAMPLAEAEYAANERNRVHGPAGWKYTVVPCTESNDEA